MREVHLLCMLCCIAPMSGCTEYDTGFSQYMDGSLLISSFEGPYYVVEPPPYSYSIRFVLSKDFVQRQAGNAAEGCIAPKNLIATLNDEDLEITKMGLPDNMCEHIGAVKSYGAGEPQSDILLSADFRLFNDEHEMRMLVNNMIARRSLIPQNFAYYSRVTETTLHWQWKPCTDTIKEISIELSHEDISYELETIVFGCELESIIPNLQSASYRVNISVLYMVEVAECQGVSSCVMGENEFFEVQSISI